MRGTDKQTFIKWRDCLGAECAAIHSTKCAAMFGLQVSMHRFINTGETKSSQEFIRRVQPVMTHSGLKRL